MGSDAEFQAAATALQGSGGTILMRAGSYGQLVLSGRGIRIEGRQGVRVERLLLDHAQDASIGNLTVAPIEADAAIVLEGAEHVELHDLLVTAAGTTRRASVELRDARWVTISHSELTHCGDRSEAWANCLLLGAGASHVTIEDSWFHDCLGCDFVHGSFGSDLVLRRNRLERSLACRIGVVRCRHQDLVELFAGRGLRVEGNRFGVYERGGAQLYLAAPLDDVSVIDNVFLGTDPRVPGYRSKVAIVLGFANLPRHVRVVNNTILTGAPRSDGYEGSLRLSSRYAGLPAAERPLVANNVIGVLGAGFACASERSDANVVIDGRVCSASDQGGDPGLDVLGRPTARSELLIDRADPRYAPRHDIEGAPRGKAPDIGAYEYRVLP